MSFYISNELPCDTVVAVARTKLGEQGTTQANVTSGHLHDLVLSSWPISFLLVFNVYVTE